MHDLLLPGRKVALLMHDSLTGPFGKMGIGMLRYSQAEVVAVIDRSQAGKMSSEFVSGGCNVPVVGTGDEAKVLGAESVLVGIAPPGGLLPDGWREELLLALDLGMSVINPLHTRLGDDPEFLHRGTVWDVRVEPEGLQPGTGAARNLDCLRVLTVGTDMSVGKMTASLEIERELKNRNVNCELVATGQVGICITGKGVALDAVRVDFAAGAIEREVVRAGANSDVVLIEGQGAMCHPAATANLALIRGSMPTHLLLVARAKQESIRNAPWSKIPPFGELMKLYQDLAGCCGTFVKPIALGIALNTSELTELEAENEIKKVSAETGLVVSDPVRFGARMFCDEIQSQLAESC